MSRDAVLLFFSLLALGAQAAVALALVVAIGGRSTARARAMLVELVGPEAMALAAVVATVATLGSLYLSEVAHFEPCVLCWYQRIAMYPLVPMLWLAVARRRTDVWPYAALLATLGAAVSAYHMVIERFPEVESAACDPQIPCSLIWTNRFGYQTIPTMALSAFALIGVLLVAGARHARRASPRAAGSGPGDEPDHTDRPAPTRRERIR